jgi:hypothetical protein
MLFTYFIETESGRVYEVRCTAKTYRELVGDCKCKFVKHPKK